LREGTKVDIYDATVQAYNEEADSYIDRYEKAEMSSLHRLMDRYLEKGQSVLDIGFGSGRDLAYLLDRGMDIWGIDPAENFVDHAKNRFPGIRDHFAVSGLPGLETPSQFPPLFDAILLIAVWMHIPRKDQATSARTLCSRLREGGRLILSYSTGTREEEKRHFETLDTESVEALFTANGCTKLYRSENDDTLGRSQIHWITDVYQKC